MKTMYAVTRNGRVIDESEDLEYIKKLKQELSYRQTGRTTKMLFQALGDPAEEVAIISWNNIGAKILFDRVCEMLENLGFEYRADTSALKIENFGKTYYFGTNTIAVPKNKHRLVKYLDQK